MNATAAAWRARGRWVDVAGETVFVVDLDAAAPDGTPPLLVLHGFPSSSFDFHRVVDALARRRRVVLFDYPGYGLSAKPDRPYTLRGQADVAVALCARFGIGRLGLLTHDIGDTVGGELLARSLEGSWAAEVTDRVVTNGSLYMDLARLSEGQRLLLGLPDQRLAPGTLGRAAVLAGLTATLAPDAEVSEGELEAVWELIDHHGGAELLPRLIRYVEERRALEGRFTPPVETHASPLTVVWGTADPIAVEAMAARLAARRPDARVVRLGGVGHYPMLEAPRRFLDAVDPGG